MDLQTLSNLFATTYNANPNVRIAAELQIRKIGNEEGMIAALLQIIASENIDHAVRQACCVWLKNHLHSTYALEEPNPREPNISIIAPSDRDALRQNILPLLTASPNRSITLQLSDTLKTIVCHDFPERWPTLMQETKTMLLSNNIREVHTGCIVALESIKAFNYRQKMDHVPRIISDLFPTLVSIATQMMRTPPSAAQEIPTMLHLILKAYRTSVQVFLSPHQQTQESIVPWGQLLFAVVNLQLPKEAVPEVEEERELCEWWIVKKWAYKILVWLFQRYGNLSQLPGIQKKEYSTFAQHFETMFAPEILTIFLRQVELYVSNQAWLSQKCQYQIFQFFGYCVKPKSTWTLLKPHFETLISTFVFPLLSFNADKQASWEEDPIDYVRMTIDEYENYSTPVSAATSFLLSMAGSRTMTTFMPMLSFINSILRSQASPVQRFGALNMVAALGPLMMRHPEVQNNMEQFMMQFVFPEYKSPEPYLRAVAFEVLGTVVKNGMIWSSEENLSAHFHAVAAAHDDTQLPVKVQAALALSEMVKGYESVQIAVSPQVDKVMQAVAAFQLVEIVTNRRFDLDLLKLCDETDLDVLNHCMETLVNYFSTELLPVAVQLTARLCESYLRLAKESVMQEDLDIQSADLETLMNSIDDEKSFSAMGIAKTLGTTIASIDSSPEILAQIQETIIPIIIYTLKNKLIDLFNNMYDLADSLTFTMRSISPNMWPVYELTYELFKKEAHDFMEEMLPVLDNFISFGTDVFKSRPDYIRMTVDMYTSCLASDQLGENDRVNGSKLIESLLLNLRGSIDDHLQTIINAAVGIFDNINTTALRLANLEVLINAVLYNPSAALHFIEASRPGMLRIFFDTWFAAIKTSDRLPRVHDKKLTIMALCALLEMPVQTIPELLRDAWPLIVTGVLHIFKDLPKAIEDRKAREVALQEDSDDDELPDEDYLNMNETDEDVWDKESAYIEQLAKESARMKARFEAPVEVEQDVESEAESNIDEELGYISPLDSVDPYASFKQALTTFQMQNPQGYQAATTVLDVDQQTILMEVMRIAETQSGSQA